MPYPTYSQPNDRYPRIHKLAQRAFVSTYNHIDIETTLNCSFSKQEHRSLRSTTAE